MQGVGFRPFVHRLAIRLGLGGWIRNQAGDVAIHVEGAPEAIERFLVALGEEAPPLATITTLAAMPLAPTGTGTFTIAESTTEDGRRQPVSPDNPLLAMQARFSDSVVAALERFGVMKDPTYEQMFHGIYSSPLLQAMLGMRASDEPPRRRPGRNSRRGS